MDRIMLWYPYIRAGTRMGLKLAYPLYNSLFSLMQDTDSQTEYCAYQLIQDFMDRNPDNYSVLLLTYRVKTWMETAKPILRTYLTNMILTANSKSDFVDPEIIPLCMEETPCSTLLANIKG